jgi:hypothetical protein
MARAVTNLKIPKIPTTVKSGTSNTSSNTSNTTNKPSNSTTPTNTANYNEILSKLNDYALKSALNNYITQQDLNSAISNIKQCNCESQATTPVDNNALSALIQKLNNYGIFNYDVPGKETIVTEFFPALITNTTSFNANDYNEKIINFANYYYSDSYSDADEESMQHNSYSIIDLTNFDLFDHIILLDDNRKTVNQSTYKTYFTNWIEPDYNAPDMVGYGYRPINFIIKPDILETPLAIKTQSGYTINLIFDYDSVPWSTGAPSSEIKHGYVSVPVEFTTDVKVSTEVRNNIKCEFNGHMIGTGPNAGGTVILTMPENITLIDNKPYIKINITSNNNIITLATPNGTSAINNVPFIKQIIIADSVTKRYVIKLDFDAYTLPPGY